MRRSLVFVAAWFAAGIGAVLLASIGVSMVGRQVTADRPPPLSADEIRSELGSDPDGGELGTTTTSSTLVPSTSTTLAPVGAQPGAGEAGAGPAPSGPAVTAAPPAPPPGGSVTTAPPPAETRSYALVGGSVTLRFSSGGVSVVAATPNAGYSVETETTHGTGVRVRFRSEGHESEVEGWWDGGPRDQVQEGGD